MLRSGLLFILFTFTIQSFAAQIDLINFDKSKNLDYLKSHKVVKMKHFIIDESSTGGYIKFYGRNTRSNFSEMKSRSSEIKVTHEPWIKPWVKKTTPIYVFFEFQKKSNKYKFIGYSSDDVQISYHKRKSVSSRLKKFTINDYKNPKYAKYISGGHDFFSDPYGRYWERGINISYPILFEVGTMELYMNHYELKKPLTLKLLKEISNTDVRSLVLAPVKGRDSTYKIVGYLIE